MAARTHDYPAALRESIAADLRQRGTPSRPDGYTVEVEASCRISACFFISDAASCINPPVPVWVVSTAQMYMQQYYDELSLKTSDRIFICIASLFLACKIVGPDKREITLEEMKTEENRFKDDVFSMQLIHAALAAERAIMYALNFRLPKYDVHQKVLQLQENNALGHPFCQSEDGMDLFKVAFESVSHALYGQAYKMYTQDEIAWGHVMFAARMMGMLDRCFLDPPECLRPCWETVSEPVHFSHEKMDDLVERIAAFFIAGVSDTEHPDQSLEPPSATDYGAQYATHYAPHSPGSPTNPADSPHSAPLSGTGYAPSAPAPFPSTSGYPAQQNSSWGHTGATTLFPAAVCSDSGAAVPYTSHTQKGPPGLPGLSRQPSSGTPSATPRGSTAGGTTSAVGSAGAFGSAQTVAITPTNPTIDNATADAKEPAYANEPLFDQLYKASPTQAAAAEQPSGSAAAPQHDVSPAAYPPVDLSPAVPTFSSLQSLPSITGRGGSGFLPGGLMAAAPPGLSLAVSVPGLSSVSASALPSGSTTPAATMPAHKSGKRLYAPKLKDSVVAQLSQVQQPDPDADMAVAAPVPTAQPDAAAVPAALHDAAAATPGATAASAAPDPEVSEAAQGTAALGLHQYGTASVVEGAMTPEDEPMSDAPPGVSPPGVADAPPEDEPMSDAPPAAAGKVKDETTQEQKSETGLDPKRATRAGSYRTSEAGSGKL